MANTLYPQLQSFQLYSAGAAIGDTSIVLTSMKSIDDVQLSMTNFGDKGFITLDPGAGELEEQISFSGLTANANGTTTLTGVKTVLCLSPYTETSGLAKQHSGGAVAVVAVTSGLLNQFANKGNAETITGVYTFTSTAKAKYNIHPTFSADEEIIDKKYADDLVVAGSPNASETVKGIVQLATGTELAAGTSAGSTGARLAPAGSSCKSTTAGAADANKIPVLGADGLLDQTFLDKARTWATIQTFSADTCQLTSDPDSANDACRKTYVDAQVAAKASTNETTGVSGEAFSAGHALYMKQSDGRLYKTVSNADESTYSFVGVALEAATGAAETKRYAKIGGVASSVGTGIIGNTAFLTDVAGVIGPVPGTNYASIGIYITTTSIEIKSPKFIRRGTQVITTDTTYTQTCGFYPRRINIRAALPSTFRSSVGNESNDLCLMNDLATATLTSYAWCVGSTSGKNRGTVSSRTQIGFVLTSVDRNGADSYTIYWDAEN